MGKLLLIVILVAVVVYLLTRMVQDGGAPRRGIKRPSRPRRPQPRPRPIAPDDDESFLRDLDRKRLDPPDDDRPA